MMRSFGITLVAVRARVLVPVLLITYYTFKMDLCFQKEEIR